MLKEKIRKMEREDLEELCIDLLEMADLKEEQIKFVMDKGRRKKVKKFMDDMR